MIADGTFHTLFASRTRNYECGTCEFNIFTKKPIKKHPFKIQRILFVLSKGVQVQTISAFLLYLVLYLLSLPLHIVSNYIIPQAMTKSSHDILFNFGSNLNKNSFAQPKIFLKNKKSFAHVDKATRSLKILFFMKKEGGCMSLPLNLDYGCGFG